MSRYILLVLLNLPLLLVGIISTITDYKTSRISRRKYRLGLLLWAVAAICLVMTEPTYNALIRYNLTNSTPMSLFDIVLLTIVLYCLFLIRQANIRTTLLSRKLARLHENLAVAEEVRHWDNDTRS